MQQRNMPKLIHWFGANDTALPSQMAAFLIVSARLDTCWDRSRLHVPISGQAHVRVCLPSADPFCSLGLLLLVVCIGQVQGDHDYFSMSSEWTDGGWAWHPAYAGTRCGKALADATQHGQRYSREFEHCSVSLDLGCEVATKDGCGVITPKLRAESRDD